MQWWTVCLCVTTKLYAFKHVRIFKRINHCSNSTEEIVVGNKLPQVISKSVDMMWYTLYALQGFSYSHFPKMLCILIPFKDKSTVCFTHIKILKSNRRDCVTVMTNEKGSQFSICMLLVQKQLRLVSHYHWIRMSNAKKEWAGSSLQFPASRKKWKKLQRGSIPWRVKTAFMGPGRSQNCVISIWWLIDNITYQ